MRTCQQLLLLQKGKDVERPNYYAIITADVRYNENLTANAKLLYAEITALCNMNGKCTASNTYFSNLFSVDNSTIQRWLKSLDENGYIMREVVYKKGTRIIEHRYMQLCGDPIGKNEVTPIGNNAQENTTPNGDMNTNITYGNNQPTRKTAKDENVIRFNPDNINHSEWGTFAREHGLEDSHLNDEFESFTEYFTVGKGKNTKRANWYLSWKTWIRKTRPTNYSRNRTKKVDVLSKACIAALNERGDR
jgi:hypothetical protein